MTFHAALKSFQVLEARRLHQLKQVGGVFSEPVECFGADFEMLQITGLYIGFVERVEPGGLAMLVTRKGGSEIAVLLLGQRAQERDVVGGLPWGQEMLSPW